MRTWYLIQFTPDLTARESRNVGVVVHDDADNWAVRMLFVDKTGAVDPALFRPLGGSLTAEEYAGWVGYYKRAIMEGRWEQAVTLHLRRKVSFHVLKAAPSSALNSPSPPTPVHFSTPWWPRNCVNPPPVGWHKCER